MFLGEGRRSLWHGERKSLTLRLADDAVETRVEFAILASKHVNSIASLVDISEREAALRVWHELLVLTDSHL